MTKNCLLPNRNEWLLMNTDSKIEIVKKPMSTSYKLVFTFAIFMLLFVLIVGSATKSKSSGFGLWLWGYTIWAMYKRKNVELVATFKVIFWFDIGAAVVALIAIFASSNSDFPYLGYDLTYVSLMLAIVISGSYALIRFFQNEVTPSENSDTKQATTSTEIDDKFWALALEESDSDKRVASIWAKCFANSSGDESKAKSEYLKIRARQLSDGDVERRNENSNTLDSSIVNSVSTNSLSKNYKNSLYAVLLVCFSVLIYDKLIRADSHPADKFKSITSNSSKLNEIDGVRLDEKLGDVLFKHKNFVKKNDETTMEGEDTYFNDVLNMRIEVSKGRVKTILSICKEGDFSSEFNGILCGNTSDDILRKFNKDVRILCSLKPDFKNGLRRYDVIKFGTAYLLMHDKVGAVRIADSALIENYVTTNWSQCP